MRKGIRNLLEDFSSLPLLFKGYLCLLMGVVAILVLNLLVLIIKVAFTTWAVAFIVGLLILGLLTIKGLDVFTREKQE